MITCHFALDSPWCNLTEPEQCLIASDGLPARLSGAWVHDKKYYVGRYLDIFCRGIGKQWKGKIAYIDLFAGPGRNVIRGTREEIDGSPFWALNRDFARYVFVDVPEVLTSLESRLARHAKRSQITLIEGDCNAVLDQVLAAVPANHLTVAFIDPTGLHISFNTIRRLVHNRKVDLLMTIQFGMGIRMNLPQYINAEKEVLTAFLGNSDWREDIEAGGSVSESCRRILDRYMSQLHRLGYQTVKDDEIPVRTDQNNLLLYSIVLASRHKLAEHYWHEVTKIGASGQRRLL